MIKKILIPAIIAIFSISFINETSAQEVTPYGTYMFVQRDTCELYLDHYKPTAGIATASLQESEIIRDTRSGSSR